MNTTSLCRGAALGALCLCTAWPLAKAQAPASQDTLRHRVGGFVADSSGRGIGFADVRLALVETGAHLQARTDSAGHFVLPAVPVGQAIVTVHRIGFEPFTRHLAIRGGDGDSVTYVLTSLALELSRVEVRDSTLSRGRREFLERMRAGGAGRFIDQEALDEMHLVRASDALRAIPGVQLRPSNRVGNLVRIRGCRPTIWVNGVRVAGAELDEVVTPDDLGGIEVYNSLAGMPPQYQDRSNPCGAILLWSHDP